MEIYIKCMIFFFIASVKTKKVPETVAISQTNEHCRNDSWREVAKQQVKDVLNRQYPSLSRGWTRVAFLNMSDMRQNCPSNWTAGDINGIRGCRQRNPSLYSCKSTFYPTNILYSNIYGRILGYARGTPDAFANSVIDGYTSIKHAYVDGVSLTHGPRIAATHLDLCSSSL